MLEKSRKLGNPESSSTRETLTNPTQRDGGKVVKVSKFNTGALKKFPTKLPETMLARPLIGRTCQVTRSEMDISDQIQEPETPTAHSPTITSGDQSSLSITESEAINPGESVSDYLEIRETGAPIQTSIPLSFELPDLSSPPPVFTMMSPIQDFSVPPPELPKSSTVPLAIKELDVDLEKTFLENLVKLFEENQSRSMTVMMESKKKYDLPDYLFEVHHNSVRSLLGRSDFVCKYCYNLKKF